MLSSVSQEGRVMVAFTLKEVSVAVHWMRQRESLKLPTNEGLIAVVLTPFVWHSSAVEWI